MSDLPDDRDETDRSTWPVRFGKLHDAVDEVAEYAHLTLGERIDMVDELTRTSWAFYTGSSEEPEFRRDVVRVVRGRR